MRMIQLSENLFRAPDSIAVLSALAEQWCSGAVISAEMLPPGLHVVIDRAAALLVVDDAREPGDASTVQEV